VPTRIPNLACYRVIENQKGPVRGFIAQWSDPAFLQTEMATKGIGRNAVSAKRCPRTPTPYQPESGSAQRQLQADQIFADVDRAKFCLCQALLEFLPGEGAFEQHKPEGQPGDHRIDWPEVHALNRL